MSSSSLTSASTTSSSSCVMSPSPPVEKPSRYFPKRFVSLLGGEENFNKLPFKKIKAVQLLFPWCEIHQRNFVVADNQDVSLRVPSSLTFSQMQGPIVTGLIGENPFLIFRVGIFPFVSLLTCDHEEQNGLCIDSVTERFPYPKDSKIISQKKSSVEFSSQCKMSHKVSAIKIQNKPHGRVTGFIFNPICITTAHPRQEDLDCFRTALFRHQRADSFNAECTLLSEERRQAIDSRYDMDRTRYTYFGEIDHRFSFRPFNSLERFLTQFVELNQAFVFIKWGVEYQTIVHKAPKIDQTNPTGAYTADSTTVREWSIDTIPSIPNEEHNVILAFWKDFTPSYVRFRSTWFKWGIWPYSKEDNPQSRVNEREKGYLIPIIVEEDQATKNVKEKTVEKSESSTVAESKEKKDSPSPETETSSSTTLEEEENPKS